MKQLHKQSTANQKRDEEMPALQSPPYSPKSLKQPSTRSFPKPLNFILKDQRFLFTLIGILIASTFFLLHPSNSPQEHQIPPILRSISASQRTPVVFRRRVDHGIGRIPAEIGRRRRRVVVTGGSGFVGSHLVDKLIGRGDEVIVIDNFFTGRKENVVHHFENSRFELIRHDVVEPILLEVDQIYHLACPASPVHYKYNPVKTIISFQSMFVVFV